MKRVLFLALFLTACGEASECDYVYGNMCFHSPGPVDRTQVEDIVNIIDEELLRDYSDYKSLSEILETVVVDVTLHKGAYFGINCEQVNAHRITVEGPEVYICERPVGGVNFDGAEIHFRYDPCLAYTAFGHELLHTFEIFELGGAPQDHLTPYMFRQYAEEHDLNVLETVEMRLFRRSMAELRCEVWE